MTLVTELSLAPFPFIFFFEYFTRSAARSPAFEGGVEERSSG
jgi:hypothetical protein